MDVKSLVDISLDILAGAAVVTCILFFSMLAGLWREGNRREDDNGEG